MTRGGGTLGPRPDRADRNNRCTCGVGQRSAKTASDAKGSVSR
jgi:hypothetical protein